MTFFFSGTVKKIFGWNRGPWGFIKCNLVAAVNESIYRQHKINTHGSWWYIEVLWSEMINLCKKLNIIYNIITCNPEPQAHAPEWCLVEPVHQIWLNSLKQFAARPAQIYMLLNKTHFRTPQSHSDLNWAEILANLILWWMNSFSASLPPTVTELRKQFDSDRRPISLWYAHAWTEHCNEEGKLKFL